jgi:proteasome lid subunit RPN8/RPN11
LRFSPTAWAKLVFLRDLGSTEIGAFGVSSVDDPLKVESVELVEQECTFTNVSFRDEAVANFIDSKVDQGFHPSQCSRLWVHTHPGDCPLPSATDEETFARVFGGCDWAVMAILACCGRSYARLRFGVGPGAAMRIKVGVDYCQPFRGSDEAAWIKEYERCIRPGKSDLDCVWDDFLLPVTDKQHRDEVLDQLEFNRERYF